MSEDARDKWLLANKTNILVYQREYRRTHKAERIAYYEKNKEKLRAYRRAYYLKMKAKGKP